MLKKIISLIILSYFIIPSISNANEKFKVITTFTVIADIAKNVAGDAAIVESITKPGAEIHGYQPTPRDIIKAQDADLILWNGLGLEVWFEQFFNNLKDIPAVTITKGIEPIGIREGPYTGKPNPHAWMSLDSAIIYINNIKDSLIQYDPINAKIYSENAENYILELSDHLIPIREKILSIPEEKRWLVTSEGAFSYLTRDYKMKELFLWPMNADQQGTPRQVRKVIDLVKEHNIKVIFSESTISPKPAMQVARETKIAYGGILYVDSLTKADGDVPTYLDLLRVTSETIARGLNAE